MWGAGGPALWPSPHPQPASASAWEMETGLLRMDRLLLNHSPSGWRAAGTWRDPTVSISSFAVGPAAVSGEFAWAGGPVTGAGSWVWVRLSQLSPGSCHPAYTLSHTVASSAQAWSAGWPIAGSLHGPPQSLPGPHKGTSVGSSEPGPDLETDSDGSVILCISL